MSISRKAFWGVKYFKNIVGRRSFQSIFIVISAFALFVGVLNVYAQEDSLKLEPDWQGTKEFHNTVSGVDDPNEDNMNSRQGLELLNGAWTAVSLVAPELTANSDELESSSTIPTDLKRGLLGMTEDAANSAYAYFPVVNIPEHIAQEWVPGYDEKVISTYAQNSSSGHLSGYEELMDSGIVGMWNKVLNLSYIVFVVIMLVAGFMIMFRHKIGGQAMVTLGNVLPGVVISLILATFSFAIAGLVIDIGGVANGLIAYIIDAGELNSIGGFWGLVGTVFTGGMTTFSIVGGGLGIGGLLALSAIPVVGPFLAGGGFLALLLVLILVGVIFVGAVKVLITLYKAYFSLLLNVVLGPLQITLGAFPGNRHMVTNWFLSILRNVLVFPVVFFIINIPNALVAMGAESNLGFPGKLVYADPSTYTSESILNATGGIFIFILRIFVLYFAAQAPKFLESWFPANTSKAMMEGMGNVKESLSKIPAIGSLFK